MKVCLSAGMMGEIRQNKQRQSLTGIETRTQTTLQESTLEVTHDKLAESEISQRFFKHKTG